MASDGQKRNKIKRKRAFFSIFGAESDSGERGEQILKNGGFLERESVTSL